MSRAGLGAIALTVVVAVGCQPGTPSTSPAESVAASVDGPSSSAPSPTDRPAGWRELVPSGTSPSAREDHTWTVDGAGTTAYLFGGQADGAPTGDFWAFDLGTESWTQRPTEGSNPIGPDARFGHNAAWVDGVGLVIFGGQGASGFFNDLWTYDPGHDSWMELPSRGAVPVPRYGSCAALGPDGRLWISHGFTSEGTRFADTRAYDFTTGTWTDETPSGTAPVERCLHGCWWTGDTFNLYAGQTTGTVALGDWWQLTRGSGSDAGAWAEVAIGGSGLSARNLYALTAFRGGHLVFGGQALDGTYLGDVWLIDHEGAPAAGPAAGGPTARAGAEMITDLERDRVLLFGGRDAGGPVADLWEFTAP